MQKKTKKAMSMLLVVALIAVIAIGGMLAYLTDRDSETNVFTVGNVDIELNEVFDEANAKLTPGVSIDKVPTITNVGKNVAWVWATVSVPKELDAYITLGNQDKTEWVWLDGEVEGDYVVYTVLHKAELAKDGVTKALFTEVTLADNIDIDPNGNWYAINGGSATPLGWSNTSGVDENGNPRIIVNAYAMQVEEFASVTEAWEAYDNQWGISGGEYPVAASNADALVEGLEAGDDVILTENIKIDPASMSNAYGKTGINVKNGQTIDGGGNTLDIKGAGGTWDSGINTTGGLIKDLTVTGSFRGIFINHNSTHSEPVILENVTIEGTTYTISCDQGTNQGLTATDCTFNGWTSYAATLGEAKFVDCNFGEGNGYAYCRPYAPTEFVGCAFEAGFELDARAVVTFENCTIGGVALTAENLATLVTSNIANATVK